MITRRDWWIGVSLITSALLAHALLPRYEWMVLREDTADVLRIDRWTGDVQHMWLIDRGGGLTEPSVVPRM